LQGNKFLLLFLFVNFLNYFCRMKKISLNGISEILSEKELKNVMGGSMNGCSPYASCSGPCGSGVGYPYNNYCGIVKSTGYFVCATAGGG
jgi:natural product precursor